MPTNFVFILLHFLIFLINLHFLLSLLFIFSYISLLQNTFLFVCSFLHLFPFVILLIAVTARQLLSCLHLILKICCVIIKVKIIYQTVTISAVLYGSEVWTISKSAENSSNTGKEKAERNM